MLTFQEVAAETVGGAVLFQRIAFSAVFRMRPPALFGYLACSTETVILL